MDRQQLLQALSPYVRRAWHHKVEHMKLAPRIIFDYELLYVEQGELDIRIGGESLTVFPGDLLLFKPGIEHEFVHSRGPCWMPHIHFDALYYEDYEEVPINFKLRAECSPQELSWLRPDWLGSVLEIPHLIRVQNHAEIHQDLMRLIHAYERRDAEFPLLQKSLVLDILYLVIKGLKSAGHGQLSLHQAAMERAVTHIMEHYNDIIRLEDLSKTACLSLYHFSRVFKQTYDVSPHQFQIRYRMERAKELMMYSRLSLSAIAEQVGYSSIYAFSKAFKSACGISPKKYMSTHASMGAPEIHH